MKSGIPKANRPGLTETMREFARSLPAREPPPPPPPAMIGDAKPNPGLVLCPIAAQRFRRIEYARQKEESLKTMLRQNQPCIQLDFMPLWNEKTTSRGKLKP